jgi:hypothetical protein
LEEPPDGREALASAINASLSDCASIQPKMLGSLSANRFIIERDGLALLDPAVCEHKPKHLVGMFGRASQRVCYRALILRRQAHGQYPEDHFFQNVRSLDRPFVHHFPRESDDLILKIGGDHGDSPLARRVA